LKRSNYREEKTAMMIIMKADATKEQVAVVIERIEFFGLGAHLSEGEERTVIGAIGDGRPVQQELFLHMPGVDRVLPISRPYKLASREFKPAAGDRACREGGGGACPAWRSI
jgi:3-deoxy-7-phosphoheptulonate synthase